MREILLGILAVFLSPFSAPLAEPNINYAEFIPDVYQVLDKVNLIYPVSNQNYNLPPKPINEVESLLLQSEGLNREVINKVLTTINCAKALDVGNNSILTIIDYSLPSNRKRLWIYDLNQKKLLFHTYVSHGINSGTLLTNFFSNKYDSKASSIGIYKTEKAYYGREGLSLRLDGLDKGFNDNAMNRYVVMHGGWYVAENFIQKYGRPGRSWGCPTVPLDQTKAIIDTIKDSSLFVIYYPNDNWLSTSKFLNCQQLIKPTVGQIKPTEAAPISGNEPRDPILFVDLNKNTHREEEEPIMVVSADTYSRLFHTTAPLSRMLRRQINNMEYIALSNAEFKNLLQDKQILSDENNNELYNQVTFVIPVVKLQRGYYLTEMHIVPYGQIKSIKAETDSSELIDLDDNYTIEFEKKPRANLRTTNGFIRWLGL